MERHAVDIASFHVRPKRDGQSPVGPGPADPPGDRATTSERSVEGRERSPRQADESLSSRNADGLLPKGGNEGRVAVDHHVTGPEAHRRGPPLLGRGPPFLGPRPPLLGPGPAFLGPGPPSPGRLSDVRRIRPPRAGHLQAYSR